MLELVQSKKVTATVTLEQSAAVLVDRYAQYVNGAADEVVDKALNYVFTKDKDFQKYAEDNKHEPSPIQPLRCKPIESAPKGRPGRKPGNGNPAQSELISRIIQASIKAVLRTRRIMTLHPRWGHVGYTSVHLFKINKLQIPGVPAYTCESEQI